MPAIIPWPAALLRASQTEYFIRHFTRSPGRALSGREQIIKPGTSRMEARLDLIRLWQPREIQQFEALVAQMEGRSNIAALPVIDAYAYDSIRAPAQQPYADLTWHTDGTGWSMMGGGVQPMQTTAAAAAGAVTLTVGLTNPVRPRLVVGDKFSINGFLYLVTTATDAGYLSFRPPLREAVPAGTQLMTDPAVFYARFADDQQGRRARDLLNHGVPIALEFVEAGDR